MKSRRRDWLLLLACSFLVLAYLVTWTTIAISRTQTRFVQLAVGAPSERTVDDASYRVLRIVRTDQVAGTDADAEPQQAPAGTSYVIAEFELTRLSENDVFGCQTWLLADLDRAIGATYGVLDTTTVPEFCLGDDVPVGRPFRFHQLYEVSDQFANRFYGVAVESTDYGRPRQVLRPAG